MVPKQHLKGPQAQVFIWRSHTFLMFFFQEDRDDYH